MQKINTILALGVLVVLLPFLGFPQSWDNFFYVVSGLVIIGMAYLLKVNGKQKTSSDESSAPVSPEKSSFSNNEQQPNTTPTE